MSHVRLMLADFKTRFSSILGPQSCQFNPIPAGACLFDHTMASVSLPWITGARSQDILATGQCPSHSPLPFRKNVGSLQGVNPKNFLIMHCHMCVFPASA